MYDYHTNIEELIGKTLKAVYVTDDKRRITFACDDDTEFYMYHSQDCCESVTLEDIAGDWVDLIGSPIVRAEENSNSGTQSDVANWPKDVGPMSDRYVECWEWTFYRIGTAKGTVVLRWYGNSNGYYGTGVTIDRKDPEPNV